MATSSPALAFDTFAPDALALATSSPNLTNARASPPKERTVRTAPSVADAAADTAPCAAASAAKSRPFLRLKTAVTAARETTAKPSTGASFGAMRHNTARVPRHSPIALNPRSRDTLAATRVRTVPSSTERVAASFAV